MIIQKQLSLHVGEGDEVAIVHVQVSTNDNEKPTVVNPLDNRTTVN